MPEHLRGISFLLHHHILAGFLSYREFSVPFPPAFIKTKTKKPTQDSQVNLKITTCQRQKQMLVAWQEMAMPSRDRRGGPLAEQQNSDLAVQRLQLLRTHRGCTSSPQTIASHREFLPFSTTTKALSPYNH